MHQTEKMSTKKWLFASIHLSLYIGVFIYVLAFNRKEVLIQQEIPWINFSFYYYREVSQKDTFTPENACQPTGRYVQITCTNLTEWCCLLSKNMEIVYQHHDTPCSDDFIVYVSLFKPIINTSLDYVYRFAVPHVYPIHTICSRFLGKSSYSLTPYISLNTGAGASLQFFPAPTCTDTVATVEDIDIKEIVYLCVLSLLASSQLILMAIEWFRNKHNPVIVKENIPSSLTINSLTSNEEMPLVFENHL